MSHPPPAAKSMAGAAYQVVRSAIVAGTLPPGSRLGPAEIAERFGFGVTPTREALSRLSAENLVIAYEQRGFRVSPLSSVELRELLALRLGFERDAIMRSIAEGGVKWEAAVIAALHILKRCPEPTPDQSEADLNIWNQRHDAFHAALMSGTDAPWLKRFHALSVAQIERYRVAILRHGALHDAHSAAAQLLPHMISHKAHDTLCEAVLSGDAGLAEQTLRHHITETANIFVDLFEKIAPQIETGV